MVVTADTRRHVLDRILGPRLAVGLLALCALELASGAMRVRGAMAVGVIALALFARRALPSIASRRDRVLLLLLFSASIAVLALPEVMSPTPQSFYEFGWRAGLVMLTWSCALSVLLVPNPGRPFEERRPLRVVVMLLATTSVVMALGHFAVENRFAVTPDEVQYLLQSRLLRRPGFMRPLDPAIAPFFFARQGYVWAGRFNGQYPPGWPILLAAFDAIGLRWLAPVCMGVLAVACTYLLGAKVGSPTVGLIAAALLATSRPLVTLSTRYMSDPAVITFCVLGAWLLVRAETPQPRRALLWTLAGTALAFATLMRPLTGTSLTLSLFGWILVRHRVRGWTVVRMALALGLGAVAPLAFMLYYNKAVTGNPFTFGYHLAQRGLQDLGFGPRGGILWGPRGQAEQFTVPSFTPAMAVAHFFSMVRDVGFEFSPAFALAPFIFLALRERLRVPLATVSVFLVLPLAQFFYFYADARFYSALLPFVLIGVGALLAQLAIKNGRLARQVLTMWVIGSVLFTGYQLASWTRVFRKDKLPYFQGVERLNRDDGKVLVFVRDSVDTPYSFDQLSWFNIDTFPGPVIVARDLGPRDGELIKRLPDYRPFLVAAEPTGIKISPLTSAP